jgi:hypothetical protein
MIFFKTACFLTAASAALLLAGCYESGGGRDDVSTDSPADEIPDTAEDTLQDPDGAVEPDLAVDPDAAADPDVDGEVICQFGEAFVAQFDKTCLDVEACVIVYLAYDCCGTSLAAGVRFSEQTRFNAEWLPCLSELPQCGCASGPPMAEDGSSTVNIEDIEVGCLDGRCMTYVPRP